MNRTHPKHLRTLAITPSTRGFGFAVVEGKETLVDWGGKPADGNKNAKSLKKVDELIARYRPEVAVLQDHSANDSRRAPRIRTLSRQISALAEKRKVKVLWFSGQQVKRSFFDKGEGTKHELAELLAKRFPEELGPRLPPKRRAWMNADARLDIFDAVALALVQRQRKQRRNLPPVPGNSRQ